MLLTVSQISFHFHKAKRISDMATRTFTTLWRWLRTELDPYNPDDVDPNMKVSIFFGGDPNAVIAFLNQLNTNSKFAGDGLNLLPGEVPVDPLVSELLVAIIKNYHKRGWTVS
jgi:hypothetical protein